MVLRPEGTGGFSPGFQPWERTIRGDAPCKGGKIESDRNTNLLCVNNMSRSLALVLVHIIFSTKNRSPFLQSTEVRSQAHAYLTGTLPALDCIPLEVGGVGGSCPFSLRSVQKSPRRRPSSSRTGRLISQYVPPI